MSNEEFDGFGRHKSALKDHSDGEKISPLLVIDRSGNARSEALKFFFTARDSEDFYFEDILNSFIALAQYPINFAIFRESQVGAHPEFWTHFCADKAQEDAFLNTLRDGDGSWSMLPKSRMFRLFPDLLEAPSFHIVVFVFSPQTTEFQIVMPDNSKFPLTKDQEERERFDPSALSITTPMEYLASCADHFFQFMWDAFDTDFQSLATDYLKHSLSKLRKGQVKWMDRQSELERQLSNTVFPNPGAESWIETLRTTFSSVLNDATDGVDLVSAMMRDHRNGTRFGKEYPPNMFLAFRMFDREPEKARNRSGPDKLGYMYNTAFLVPQALHKNFRIVLKELRAVGRKARADVDAKRYNSFGEAFELDGKRRLFGKITVNAHEVKGRSNSVNQTLHVLDGDFWELLEAPKGIDKCIEVLGSPVGSKNRSLVDSVYNTGLVYTNHLFRNGGVDRLGNLNLADIRSIEDVPKSCRNDVRRVVLFYYIFGELLGWAGEGNVFDPDRMAAVLIPVKMRGSVWSVAMHAVYTPSYDNFFADQRYWQGYFKLATDLSMKSKQVFDRYMWGLADEMVTDQVIKMVKQVLSDQDSDDDGAIEDLNLALRSMERKTPFALPEFKLDTVRPSAGVNFVRFPPDSEANLWLVWEIVDNSLFTARQPWSLKATRNFRRIVRHAVLTAITQKTSPGPRGI